MPKFKGSRGKSSPTSPTEEVKLVPLDSADRDAEA